MQIKSQERLYITLIFYILLPFPVFVTTLKGAFEAIVPIGTLHF